MRKILGLTIAAVLVMGLVGGGTWAFFSDTETVAGNYFAAGTIDLTLGGTTTSFALSGLKPGDSADPEVDVDLTNAAGGISANLSISIGLVTNYENGIVGGEGKATLGNDTTTGATEGELGSLVKIAIWIDENDDGWDDGNDYYLTSAGGTQAYSSGSEVPGAAYETINTFATGSVSWSDLETLAGGETAYFKISYDFPEGGVSDNAAQSDNCTFDFTFTLSQS
jgi:spore coat-associated protein N